MSKFVLKFGVTFILMIRGNILWTDWYAIFIIALTGVFSIILTVVLVRGFETDYFLRVEDKYFGSNGLQISGLDRVYGFVSPACAHERRVDIIRCVFKRLKKSLKTDTRIIFFIKIITSDIKIGLTFDELVNIVLNTVEDKYDFVLHKIMQGYNYHQIMKTENIPLKWSDSLYENWS